MNLLQTVISYYHGEARHGLWGTIIGGLLLIGGFMFWKWAAPFSLLKGFSVPMLLFGLLVSIGGGADSIYTNKTMPKKIALYQKDPTAFLKQERVKTEKTHRGWHGIRIFWAILGLSGLVLSLLIKKPFWIGAGLGTVALAAIISLFELYSMRFNEQYYQAIQSATVLQVNTNIKETRIDIQQRVKIQQTTIEQQSDKQIHAKSVSDTLPPQNRPIDSLKTLSAPAIATVIIRDSVTYSTPYDLQNLVLANATSPPYYNDKKRKVLDYYNSDLIQPNGINAKHCWFSKKYIKK